MPFNISLGTFYGIDSIIDFLILVVAAIVSYQSHKIYNLIKENNYRFFSWAFFSIALAYAFKILANLTLPYYTIIQQPNFVVAILHEFREAQIINFFANILYSALFVLGFLVLFLIMTKTSTKENIILFLYLSLISVLFSIYFGFIFHTTIILLLLFLTVYFYHNHQQNKSRSSLLTYVAFVIMLAGSLVFILHDFCQPCYLTSEIFFFAGFLTLLANHISLKNEQKKNKTRSDSRHPRDIKKESAR